MVAIVVMFEMLFTRMVLLFSFAPLPASIPVLLRLGEVKWAALHVDETLRMSALSLLCTDVRVTTVPSRAETTLLQEVSILP